MAYTIALINMKGGVSKTTIAVNLAWYAAYRRNEKVLVVDLDPQFNASQILLGNRTYEQLIKKQHPTVREVFETPPGKSGNVIVTAREWTDKSKIDLLPSSLELAWTLKNPFGKEQRLAKFLGKVKPEYNWIFIDCAPTESMLTMAAYLGSDSLLVPVKPEFLSTIGLPLLVRSFNDFKQDYGDHPLNLAGIVFNSASKYRGEYERSTKYVRAVAAENGWYVFTKELEFSDSYAKGAREGKPIFRTSYAREAKKVNFEAFAREFFDRVGT
jgi:chromosome partitioning protein